MLHCLILLYQVITLNVAANSYTSNSILSLLVSNQFMELKSSVFKKFERENLFQLSFSDSIERFQLFVFIFVIGIRNLSQIASSQVFARVIKPLFLIYCTEVGVDVLKHAFITKFNHIPPNVYKHFKESLSIDFVSISSNVPDQSTVISRKMGFSPLPHTCLVLVVLMKVLKGKELNLHFYPLIYILLTILKLSLGLFLNFWTKCIQNNAKDSKTRVEIDEKSD